MQVFDFHLGDLSTVRLFFSFLEITSHFRLVGPIMKCCCYAVHALPSTTNASPTKKCQLTCIRPKHKRHQQDFHDREALYHNKQYCSFRKEENYTRQKELSISNMSDPAAIEKKIQELENEMARTQKNKATNYREYRMNQLL